jgi:hypothetical protein
MLRITDMGNLCGGQATPTKEETRRKIEDECSACAQLCAKFMRIEAGSRKEGDDAFERGASMETAVRHFDRADAAAALVRIQAAYLHEIQTRLAVDPAAVSADEYHRHYTAMAARGDELLQSSDATQALALIRLLQ